jgi:hypothetical protein
MSNILYPWQDLAEAFTVQSLLANIPMALPERYTRIAQALSHSFGRQVYTCQVRAYEQKVSVSDLIHVHN